MKPRHPKKIIEYLGIGGEDGLQGFTTSSGTGQSGANTLATGSYHFFTGANAIQLQQGTSSGTGKMQNNWRTVPPRGATRFRCIAVLRPGSNDSDWDTILLNVSHRTGSHILTPALRLQSNKGTTEEYQYFNESDAWADTGLTWRSDASLTFTRVEFVYSIEESVYVSASINGEQATAGGTALSKSADGNGPRINAWISLTGETTTSYAFVDSFVMEAIG